MARPDLSFDSRNLGLAAGDSCGLLVTLLGDLVERAAVAVQRRLPALQPLPALHHHVHVLRIKLYSVADALGNFGCGEACTRSEEGFVASLPTLCVVQQRAPHDCDRLLSRMGLFLVSGFLQIGRASWR